MKRAITNNIFVDAVLTNTLVRDRTVYKNKQGEFIKEMGNKKYLNNDVYETHYRSIPKEALV